MSELPTYEGEVEGILRPTPDEMLRELMGVIEAALEKSIRLTKSGIPPKPLWSAVNDRLLWQDPKSILYDWDEVDQVRFIYSLAGQIALVQPDDERLLTVGPGADAFFFASSTRRAEMLLRAYVDTTDWDERCDARNDQGHRHNFGQTFRRDFLADSWTLRQAMISALGNASDEGWTRAVELAIAITRDAPNVLISEDDEAPLTVEGEADPEIERLAEYWIVLAARFGWVDLARTPTDRAGGGERLFRLTPLGRVIVGRDQADYLAEEHARDDATPFVVQPNNDVIFYREEGDIGDEFLLRRIASDSSFPSWDEQVATYHVTPDSLRRALESGLDLELVQSRIIERTKADVPQTFTQLFKDADRQLGKVGLTQGLSVVEMHKPTKKAVKALGAAGFQLFDTIAVVPWRRWQEFCRILGSDVTEGFRYPCEEPLGAFTGSTLELDWSALPMVARDLLDSAGADGDPPSVVLDEKTVGKLAKEGWTPKSVAEAVLPITRGGALPKWLTAELD